MAAANSSSISGRSATLVYGHRLRSAKLPSTALEFACSRRVRFLGPVPDMARYYAAADAFVLPTIYEPFSNACLEARAAGLPVITTRYNGFAEIIEPGAEGEVLENPRDISALASAIENWRDPVRRELLRVELQTHAAQFTIEENVRQTLALITR